MAGGGIAIIRLTSGCGENFQLLYPPHLSNKVPESESSSRFTVKKRRHASFETVSHATETVEQCSDAYFG